MNLRTFWILIFSNYFVTPSFANICSDSPCPAGRQPSSLCLAERSTYNSAGILFKGDNLATCKDSEMVLIDSAQDIVNVLSRYAKECKSIKTLIFAGHGADGQQFTGDLNFESVQKLNPFQCLFDKGAFIHFEGCNVGSGCAGDILMLKTAQALLGKGGTIWAPTAFATSLPFVIPRGSLNGKTRQLTYSPGSNLPFSWTLKGLAIGDGGNVVDRCSGELGKLLEAYEEGKKRCASSYDTRTTAENVKLYRKILNKMKTNPNSIYADDSDFDALDSGLTELESGVFNFRYCEGPRSSDKKINATSK